MLFMEPWQVIVTTRQPGRGCPPAVNWPPVFDCYIGEDEVTVGAVRVSQDGTAQVCTVAEPGVRPEWWWLSLRWGWCCPCLAV